MLQATANNANLSLLAGYDFLDLCLPGKTGSSKTHTAQLIHALSSRVLHVSFGNFAKLESSSKGKCPLKVVEEKSITGVGGNRSAN